MHTHACTHTHMHTNALTHELAHARAPTHPHAHVYTLVLLNGNMLMFTSAGSSSSSSTVENPLPFLRLRGGSAKKSAAEKKYEFTTQDEDLLRLVDEVGEKWTGTVFFFMPCVYLCVCVRACVCPYR